MNKAPRTPVQQGCRVVAALCSAAATLVLLVLVCATLPLSLPPLLGYDPYAIVTGSMEPALPTGSLVYVQAADAAALQPGEIVAYTRSDGTLVVHRVAENHTGEGELITQGDANEQPDLAPTPYASVVGKVVFQLPLLGTYAQLLTDTHGKLCALGTVVAALALYAASGLLKRAAKRKKRAA